MGKYVIVYTGFPEKFEFTYDYLSYDIYSQCEYGNVFLIGVVDRVLNTWTIKMIDKGTLEIVKRIKFSFNTFIDQYFNQYIGQLYNAIDYYYDNNPPSKSNPLRPIYNNTIKHIYDSYNDKNKNIYSMDYYTKYSNQKFYINNYQYQCKVWEYDFDNVITNIVYILKNLYDKYDYFLSKNELTDLQFNPEYDFIKNLEQNIRDYYVLVINNRYYKNKNHILIGFDGKTMITNILMFMRYTVDIYDLKEDKFVVLNVPIPITNHVYFKYEVETQDIYNTLIYPIPQLSLFEGFYFDVEGTYPFRLRLSEEYDKRIIHIVGVKRNEYYNILFSVFWDLFNIYNIDYYNLDFVINNVYHEKYREAYIKYNNGDITKEELIDQLKIPLLLCHNEPRKPSVLPVDEKSKLDFSIPTIMIFED